MKTFTSVVAAFGLFAGLTSALGFEKRWDNGTVATVTDVYTAFTTVCPSPTTFVVNNSTITVSSSTTITITNCPCTVVHTTPAASVTPAAPAGTGVNPGGPIVSTSTSVVPAGGAGAGATSTKPATFATGAAAVFGPEMGLAALGAVAAVLL